MNAEAKIKAILSERNMTIKELSKSLGKNERFLYNKFSRNSFTEKDLKEIANALDCDYDGIFTFRDTGRKL